MYSKKLFFIIPVLFLLFNAIIVWILGVNIPFFDQWAFIPLLGKLFSGVENIVFADLIAQHNEHRLLFPRIIFLTLAYFTHWNIKAELWVNIFLMACIAFFMLQKIKKDFLEEDGNQNFNFFVIFSISLLFFSFGQNENIVWGWQIQIFLNILFVVLGIHFLTQPQSNMWHFSWAILCGLVAVFSFANGLLYFLIGFLAIFLQKKSSFSQKITYLSVWLLVTIFVFLVYFQGYQRPLHHPTPMLSIQYVVSYMAYIFTFLGCPIFESDAIASMISGMVGVGIYIFGIVQLFFLEKRNTKPFLSEFTPYYFYIFLSFYAIGSALISGLGRVGNEMGLAQASASRYVTICNLFWVCNFVFIFLTLKNNFNLKIMYKKIVIFFAGLLLLAIFASHIVGILAMYEHKIYMENCQKMWLNLQKETENNNQKNYTKTEEKAICDCVGEKLEIIKIKTQILKKHKLSFFFQ